MLCTESMYGSNYVHPVISIAFIVDEYSKEHGLSALGMQKGCELSWAGLDAATPTVSHQWLILQEEHSKSCILLTMFIAIIHSLRLVGDTVYFLFFHLSISNRIKETIWSINQLLVHSFILFTSFTSSLPSPTPPPPPSFIRSPCSHLDWLVSSSSSFSFSYYYRCSSTRKDRYVWEPRQYPVIPIMDLSLRDSYLP